MHDTERMRQVSREIVELLVNNPAPEPNPIVVEQLAKYAAEFRGRGSIASEKTAVIASRAADFYSTHKHQRYPGGPDQLYIRMLGWADAIYSASKRYDAEQAKLEAAISQP